MSAFHSVPAPQDVATGEPSWSSWSATNKARWCVVGVVKNMINGAIPGIVREMTDQIILNLVRAKNFSSKVYLCAAT